MLQVNYLPYDDYRGESKCDILCDVCGDRLLGANCMMDICDVRVLQEIKSACDWKSIRHPARGWMDICPTCCKKHPELCFRRASAEEDFADIVYPKQREEANGMRVYDVSFRAKPEGSEEYVSVRDGWIIYSTDNSEAIKAVCGSYPSRWDGMRCDELTPILESGLSRLWEKRGRRFPFATTGYGSVEETIVFLSRVLDGCTRYPHAFVVVRIE